MRRMKFMSVVLILVALSATARGAPQPVYRLYDGVTAFINNPRGEGFTLTLEVADINFQSVCPGELLVKVYPPDGMPVVREVIPDDGVSAPSYAPPVAGWDHEAWYYATCYSRGLRPMVRWSSFSDPARLAAMPKRTFKFPIAGGQKGIYRVVIVGTSDHYVSLKTDPALKYGVSGSPEWLHGHGGMYRKSYIYVPKGTAMILGLFLQNDQPQLRGYKLSDADGNVLLSGDSSRGLSQQSFSVEKPGQLDEQILTLEVSDGPGDFLLNITLRMAGQGGRGVEVPPITLENFDRLRPLRGAQSVTAVMCDDPATAKAVQNGAIYHDGKLFWQMHQVRLYDWLKKLRPEDFEYPKNLPQREGYGSVGSHQSPRRGRPGWGDRVMHSYALHKNPKALNFAIRDTFFGMRLIGPGDHVAIGPKSNLAYEMGCYSFFYPRPAWRILQQTDAPKEVKDAIREFVIQVGDRLAFCRGMALVNGNALASLVAGMRYCLAGSQDAMLKKLFDTYFERFVSGGLGERVGQGPSGGIQESFGYDFHYGSYVLRGWRAVNADIKDPRLLAAYRRVLKMYSYVWSPLGYSPQNSRTSNTRTAGGYSSWDPRPDLRWKGHGGGDLTESVMGANEWFAARRRGYYFLTYHGRLTPTWMGEGFHGQIGFGGGAICQLHIPGKDGGTVIGSKVNASYGKGMHLSQWRNFHIHGLVGTTTDGQPLVTANSEHPDARLEGNTVTSSGEVRQSSVRVTRSYTYGPKDITCTVQLEPSGADNTFSIWGGRPALRGKVSEAYEMIPYADVPRARGTGRKGKGATRVVALGGEGEEIGPVTERPTEAAGVLIDRHGYGARIEFAAAKPVLLGQNDTVLIQLADSPTPAGEIGFEYKIIPYMGDPPTGAIGAAVARAAPEYEAAVLGAIAGADAVAAALGDQKPHVVKGADDRQLAEIRLAVAGGDLAVSASVVDKKVTRGPKAWNGSCLEVFGSMLGGSKIGQVFLMPTAGDAPAKALRAVGGSQQAAPEIRITSAATKSGYQIQALIPLSMLELDATKEKITLEFQVSAARSVNARGRPVLQHATLFGSRLAYQNNSRYGVFVLKKK